MTLGHSTGPSAPRVGMSPSLHIYKGDRRHVVAMAFGLTVWLMYILQDADLAMWGRCQREAEMRP